MTTIVLDPEVLAGKPVIRGTRLSVEFVIGLMAEGWNETDIMTNYSGITHEDIMACLAYARDTLSSERVFPNQREMRFLANENFPGTAVRRCGQRGMMSRG